MKPTAFFVLELHIKFTIYTNFKQKSTLECNQIRQKKERMENVYFQKCAKKHSAF